MVFFRRCMKASPREVEEELAEKFSYTVNFTEKLGRGSYSKVYKGRSTKTDKLDEFVAVKEINKKYIRNEVDKIAIEQEIQILQKLNHPNIIKLHATYEKPKYWYLVMEYIAGGELLDRICERKTYSEKDAKDVCRILFDTMAYCHEHKVAHRDLKPRNLLLVSPDNDTDIKIADFGFAKNADNDHCLRSILGTPGYIAPEILKGEPYGTKVDMWSLGVIMYNLLSGKRLGTGVKKFDDSIWQQISDEAKTLLIDLLETNPSKRFCAKDALKSSWIRTDYGNYNDLRSSLRNLKQFSAKKEWKKVILATMAAKKFSLVSIKSKKKLSVPEESLKEFNPRKEWRESVLAVRAAQSFSMSISTKKDLVDNQRSKDYNNTSNNRSLLGSEEIEQILQRSNNDDDDDDDDDDDTNIDTAEER